MPGVKLGIWEFIAGNDIVGGHLGQEQRGDQTGQSEPEVRDPATVVGSRP